MLSAVEQLLPLGIAVAISPPAILAVSLMIGGPRGRVTSGAFVLGWILGLTLALAVVLLIAGGQDYSAQSAPSRAASVAKLVLGMLFLVLAANELRRRPSSGQSAPVPSWMRLLDRFGAAGSFGAGFVGSAFNPKNLSLATGAALVIAQAGVGLTRGAILMALFIFLGALGVGIPLALAVFGGERGAKTLAGWRAWLAVNNSAIMIVLFLILGAIFIGHGIEELF